MRLYLAGPMTGYPEFNVPAFRAAAAAWRAAGWDVRNPAESFGGATDLPYRTYVVHDLTLLRECQAIAMLPGWDGPGARGSVWEREVAAALLGLPVYDATQPEPPPAPESILEEAHRLVHGNRGVDYGHPLDDFTRTGRMWAAILGLPEVTPQQVALCMVALKISRECHRPKRDNRVDGAGYLETLDLIEDRLARTR